MIRISFVLLFLNSSLFSETLKVDNSMPWMVSWLLGSLLLVGLFFWAIYKAMKTKNAKYGYVIFLSLLLMVGLFLFSPRFFGTIFISK